MEKTFVYVIAQDHNPENFEEEKLFKIGIAVDVAARLAQLQTGNPHVLDIAFSVQFPTREIARLVERQAHHYLTEHHASGEWFRCTYTKAAYAMPCAIEPHKDRLGLKSRLDVLKYLKYPVGASVGAH